MTVPLFLLIQKIESQDQNSLCQIKMNDSMGRITKPGDMLVFSLGHRPIYGKQVLYFTDKELTKRSTIATPNRLQTNAK